MSVLTDIDKLLKSTMGLDAASIGRSNVERAMQQRIRACSLDDSQAYWKHLRSSDTELQELIEAVVVQETWFFRDREAFVAMARLLDVERLRSGSKREFRLLSLPCSTGEEPYSMAMALREVGFPSDLLKIDAVDISCLALKKAKKAVYRKNSFRGRDLSFRDRYFETGSTGFRLADALRRQVTFIYANVLDPEFLPGRDTYDIVFCRNLLIYFDRPTQDCVIQVLKRLLKANGFLFLGPAETGLGVAHNFVSANIPLAFAFQKGGPAVSGLQREKQAQGKRLTIKTRARPVVMPPVHAVPRKPLKAASVHQTKEVVAPLGEKDESGLKTARRLADQGHLAEAAKLCEDHLKTNGASVQAFYLLGLVRDAAGESNEASDFYRKALYLKPDHYETLIHLAYLKEKRGDSAGAKTLHNRARRAKEKSGQ